jgi:hypothetical protein
VDQTQDVYDGYGDETGQYDSQQGPVNTGAVARMSGFMRLFPDEVDGFSIEFA